MRYFGISSLFTLSVLLASTAIADQTPLASDAASIAPSATSTPNATPTPSATPTIQPKPADAQSPNDGASAGKISFEIGGAYCECPGATRKNCMCHLTPAELSDFQQAMTASDIHWHNGNAMCNYRHLAVMATMVMLRQLPAGATFQDLDDFLAGKTVPWEKTLQYKKVMKKVQATKESAAGTKQARR